MTTTLILVILVNIVMLLVAYRQGFVQGQKRRPTFYSYDTTADLYKVGESVQYFGKVVKVERVENTRLTNGGSVPCYAIYCDPDLREWKP